MKKHRDEDGLGIIVHTDPETGKAEVFMPPERPCEHPSGFLFLRRESPDGVTLLDLMYCPHCGERRRVTSNGTVVESCVAGGEWRAWQ